MDQSEKGKHVTDELFADYVAALSSIFSHYWSDNTIQFFEVLDMYLPNDQATKDHLELHNCLKKK